MWGRPFLTMNFHPSLRGLALEGVKMECLFCRQPQARGGAKTASRWWGNIPLSSFWVSLKRRIDYNIFRIVHRLPLHKWPLHSAIPQCPPNWMHYLQIFGKITTLAVLPGYCSLSFCTGSLWSSLTNKYWLHMQLCCCETYILIFTQSMAMFVQVWAWHPAI